MIKKIEYILAAFSWSAEAKENCNAKVSWKEVCMTIKQGGLCIMDIEVWNEALIMNHIYDRKK